MVGHINVETQVDADFSHARRKAFFRRIGARLRRDPALATPPCFGEVSKTLGARGGIRRGRRVVRSTDIVGSVGRCSDFDRAFLPAKMSVGKRWKQIDRAFHRGKEFPPVALYKIRNAYFALDGNHRVSVYRYHGVEWIDAEVTEFGTRFDALSNAARPRIVNRTKEHTMPDGSPKRHDKKVREIPAPSQNIEVRWSLRDDNARIAELMELNGISRASAFEERFIVAEKNGEVLSALQYRTESKRLLLGLLISDPWTEERPLAVALYAGAGELAREIGVWEVRARTVVHTDDYPCEAGYRRRYLGGWYLDASRPLRRRKELPAGGWRRMIALQSVPAIPFFRAFRGATRCLDGRG